MEPAGRPSANTRPTKMRWSPPSCTACRSHSKGANAPGIRGTPVAPEIGSKPTHLPAPDWAKRVDNPSWVSPRTLTPQVVAVCQTEKLATLRATENNTSGGSRDTEVNELTVIP